MAEDFNHFQHKRSDVAAKVPKAADFLAGQILVNIKDGKLFLLADGVVKAFSNDDIHQTARNLLIPKAGAIGLGGFSSTLINDGNFGGGVYKPTFTGSNFRLISTSGAFEFQAPDGDVYTMIIKIGIGAGAGPITMTGFTKVAGDDFTTTAGDHFLVYITKIYDVVLANIVGLQ